jgi:hypothetical protein
MHLGESKEDFLGRLRRYPTWEEKRKRIEAWKAQPDTEEALPGVSFLGHSVLLLDGITPLIAQVGSLLTSVRRDFDCY